MSERSDENVGGAPGATGTPGPERAGDAPWWRGPHQGPAQGSDHGWAERPGGHDPYAQGPSPQGPYGPDPYGPAGVGPSAGWSGGPWGGGWGWAPPGGAWGHQMGAPPQGAHGAGSAHGRGHRTAAAVAAAGLTALSLAIGVGIGYGVWSAGSAPAASSAPLGGGQAAPGTPTGTASTGTASTGKISTATGAPSDIAAIAKKVTPSLVDINTVLGYQTEQAAGTGMVLTPTGKVLTNNHVIEGSTSIKVTDLGNTKTYTATVVGYDRTADVAVIQLKNASGLKTVTLGNSSTAKVGQAIVGIGNAGGTGGTPSAAGGSVTALGQAITASDQGSFGTTREHLTGLIETNANIQPGDSGGPLVTTAGKVLGMDTAASAAQGYSFQGAATGQGYSIPVNTAMAIARQIIAGKSTASVHIGGTGFLGVYVETVAARTRAPGGFGFRTTTATATGTRTGAPGTTGSPTQGAIVAGVIPQTPAQRAGLAKGDVITSVAGTAVKSSSDVTKIMMQYHPGQVVKVVWTTPSGQVQSAAVALGSGPAD